MVFRAARKDGVITEDPAEFVSIVKARGRASSRRAFTQEELTAVVKAASPEWKSLIRFGLYTGMRLGGGHPAMGQSRSRAWRTASSDGKDWQARRAPARRYPLMPRRFALEPPLKPSEPIHPVACETVIKQGKSGSLSNQFARILAKAGLRTERPHCKAGDGRKGRREMAELSFHSLRHTAISMMRNAGVSAATAMAVAGHDSEQMSLHYTHVDRDSLVKAIESFDEV